MKGITHFTAGLAAASLVPGAVEMASQGSLILLLGGVAGVLPDTIDFKWSKFVEDYQFEVDPDPHAPDPQAIAEQVAKAIDAAYEADGAPVGLMIHTTRVGADAWRQITVTLDATHQEVRCQIGPVVTTGQVAIAGTSPETPVAAAKTKHPFHDSYLDTLRVNIFSGPSWELRKENGKVALNFIAWHRRGTHSLFFAACLIALGTGLFGFRHGLAMAAGVATHIAEDQLGFMGCALFWPFHHRRFHGLGLWHSGDAMANFTSVWVSMAILLWQLNAHHPEHPMGESLAAYGLATVAVPLGLLLLIRSLFFPRVPFRRSSLPRVEPVPTEDSALIQNLKEQDVLNEVGGSESAP